MRSNLLAASLTLFKLWQLNSFWRPARRQKTPADTFVWSIPSSEKLIESLLGEVRLTDQMVDPPLDQKLFKELNRSAWVDIKESTDKLNMEQIRRWVMEEVAGISPDEAKLLQVEEGLNYLSVGKFLFWSTTF